MEEGTDGEMLLLQLIQKVQNPQFLQTPDDWWFPILYFLAAPVCVRVRWGKIVGYGRMDKASRSRISLFYTFCISFPSIVVQALIILYFMKFKFCISCFTHFVFPFPLSKSEHDTFRENASLMHFPNHWRPILALLSSQIKVEVEWSREILN